MRDDEAAYRIQMSLILRTISFVRKHFGRRDVERRSCATDLIRGVEAPFSFLPLNVVLTARNI